MIRRNPFSLVKASDFSDEQIQELWVEVGKNQISQIIEPQERLSKFILGGKGAGKTHILRYHSYSVMRLRTAGASALNSVVREGYLAVFLRATAIDAARFEATSQVEEKWQQLFGIYVELRLGELVLEALCDLVESCDLEEDLSVDKFIEEIAKSVIDLDLRPGDSLRDLQKWISSERQSIDHAVINSAFSGNLNITARFSLGGLSLALGRATSLLSPSLAKIPLLYLIDEVENFSESQQKVVNTLIRYTEGNASFRVSGRLYSMKTHATIGGGEENKEGSEFKTSNLDDIMRKWSGYSRFAHKFVAKRIEAAGGWRSGKSASLSTESVFESVDRSNFYSNALRRVQYEAKDDGGIRKLNAALMAGKADPELASEITSVLTEGIPPLISRINILLFCKKARRSRNLLNLANKIAEEATAFVDSKGQLRGTFYNAYGHWAIDAFAQCCREAGGSKRVIYAGFSTFVQMSCNNPRNLLIVLGRAYALAAFRDVDMLSGEMLSIELQTIASAEAASFLYESDSNFGSPSVRARQATSRLGELLRTARFALNIPEVSPLSISFSEEGLTENAQKELVNALNYSFVYELADGRPDRNSQRLHRKIHLNPLLAPKWELPLATRGDIHLTPELMNSIFDFEKAINFERNLKILSNKWNFQFGLDGDSQRVLFQ